MQQPLRVEAFTADVAHEVGAIARALPYRSTLGIDPERVVWTVAGQERIGVAWAPDHPDGPCWMVAIAEASGRRVARSRVRSVVALVAGSNARFELAPPFDGAPTLTMARVPVAHGS